MLKLVHKTQKDELHLIFLGEFFTKSIYKRAVKRQIAKVSLLQHKPYKLPLFT